MTVAELIAELQKLSPDQHALELKVYDNERSEWDDVESVYVTTDPGEPDSDFVAIDTDPS